MHLWATVDICPCNYIFHPKYKVYSIRFRSAVPPRKQTHVAKSPLRLDATDVHAQCLILGEIYFRQPYSAPAVAILPSVLGSV